MPKKKAADKQAVQKEEDIPEMETGKALLFELDNVALKGRELLFDALSGVLEQKGVSFSVGTYCQRCLYPPVRNYLQGVLASAGKGRVSAEKLILEVNEALMMMLADGSVKISAEFGRVLEKSKDAGAKIGAFSVYAKDSTDRIVEKAGLKGKGVTVHCDSREDKDLPSSDSWLKLAKIMGVPPSCCVVMASSSRACKSALSAGMRCVVLTDRFTAFQDFGGADWVTEVIDGRTVERVLDLLDS